MSEKPQGKGMSELFSARQQAVVASGITAVGAMLIISFVAFLLWGAYSVLSALSAVLTPLIVALILTLFFKPYYRLVYSWVGRRNWLAMPLFFFSILFPIGMLIYFFGSLLVDQLISFFDYIPALIEKINAQLSSANPKIDRFIAKYGLEENLALLKDPQLTIKSWLGQLSFNAVGAKFWGFGVEAVKYVLSFIGWLIVPVYMVYFLVMPNPDRGKLEGYFPFLKEETRHDVSYLIDQFLTIVVSYFRGQVLVVLIQGVLYGTGFWIVGLPYGFMIGFTLGLLNMVPYLGCFIGLSVALPMAFFSDGGSLLRVGLVLAVFVTVQCLDGYWITPKIQGKRTGLSDVAVIFSVLFWGAIFKSFLGLLLAIPLSAFMVAFFRLLKRKYIKELI